MSRPAALILAIALSACGSGTYATGASADEDQMLNNAAAMLDANSVAVDTLPSATGNQR